MTEVDREPGDPLNDYARLSVKQFASMRGVSERTVRRWISERKIPVERTGDRGHWRVLVRRFVPRTA